MPFLSFPAHACSVTFVISSTSMSPPSVISGACCSVLLSFRANVPFFVISSGGRQAVVEKSSRQRVHLVQRFLDCARNDNGRNHPKPYVPSFCHFEYKRVPSFCHFERSDSGVEKSPPVGAGLFFEVMRAIMSQNVGCVSRDGCRAGGGSFDADHYHVSVRRIRRIGRN